MHGVGGKGSLVLGELCQRAGIMPCVLVVCDLEYKSFIEWVELHKPPELSVINTGQDINWLVSHSNMLFRRTVNVRRSGFILFSTGDRKNITKSRISICCFLEGAGLMEIMSAGGITFIPMLRV